MRPTAHLIWFFVLLGISFDSVSARQSEMGAEGMSQANSSLQAGVKPGSVKGVVWEIPDDFQEAAEDLLEMQLMGISAVRTGLVFDQGLIRMADSLGLVLYRELPLHGLGPRSLTDSLSRADSLLLALVEQGKGYSSAGPIGLVRNSDTSSPAVCPELQRLTNILHQTGNQAYYVTNFIESDACSDAVDFVLIDALDHEHPEQLLERWKKAHQTPVGLARIGTSATPGSEPGSLIKGSPQYQARFLENVFAGLQSVQSVGMFVHRWKD